MISRQTFGIWAGHLDDREPVRIPFRGHLLAYRNQSDLSISVNQVCRPNRLRIALHAAHGLRPHQVVELLHDVDREAALFCGAIGVD